MKIFIQVSNLWGVIYIFLSVFVLSNSAFFFSFFGSWILGLKIWGMCYLLNIYLWFSVMAPKFNWMAIFHINLHLQNFTTIWKLPLMIFCVYVCNSASIFLIRWILLWIVTLPTSFPHSLSFAWRTIIPSAE